MNRLNVLICCLAASSLKTQQHSLWRQCQSLICVSLLASVVSQENLCLKSNDHTELHFSFNIMQYTCYCLKGQIHVTLLLYKQWRYVPLVQAAKWPQNPNVLSETICWIDTLRPWKNCTKGKDEIGYPNFRISLSTRFVKVTTPTIDIQHSSAQLSPIPVNPVTLTDRFYSRLYFL